MPDNASVDTRLGRIEATAEHFNERLDKIENKLDVVADAAADIRHIKANMKMMQEPVKDYQTMKHRATGMWMLICAFLGIMGTLSTLAGYLLRAYILNIGTP